MDEEDWAELVPSIRALWALLRMQLSDPRAELVLGGPRAKLGLGDPRAELVLSGPRAKLGLGGPRRVDGVRANQ